MESILPEPLADSKEEYLIKDSSAFAYEVKKGDFIQVIDLYNPSNIQAVASVVDETSMGNALTVQKIAGASGCLLYTSPSPRDRG